jgi:hypothetical protein
MFTMLVELSGHRIPDETAGGSFYCSTNAAVQLSLKTICLNLLSYSSRFHLRPLPKMPAGVAAGVTW